MKPIEYKLQLLLTIHNELIKLLNKQPCFTGSVEIHFKEGEAMNKESFEQKKFFDIYTRKAIKNSLK